MATCASCNQTILFGGVREGVIKFCNARCREAGRSLLEAYDLPNFVVAPRVAKIFNGECPKCGSQGPVDLRTSYLVYSVIVLTFSKTETELLCHFCARQKRIKAAALTMLVGWWGVPLGIVATPFYVGKNLWEARGKPAQQPSKELDLMVRRQILEEGYQPQGHYPRYRASSSY